MCLFRKGEKVLLCLNNNCKSYFDGNKYIEWAPEPKIPPFKKKVDGVESSFLTI